jgi:predicted AAA+ superfamily ATPase
MAIVTRALEPVLLRAAAEFPAVVLTGPRQSGKTTLLKKLFGDRFGYLLLDLPDIRALALEDPRGLLDAYPPPLILDEVHHAPDLLPYIKARIDEERLRPGQYLLTGSQNLLLLEKVQESLAGRAAVLRLLPLSRREAVGEVEAPFPWEVGAHTRKARPEASRVWVEFLRGGYPELVASPGRDVTLWHASYVQTYLERDVRTLRQVGDLTQFQSFLRALAARSGQLLNMSDIARDLGISVNTVKQWLSVLEATFQIVVLRPYHANVGKRLVKTPKVYFTDTGTLCYLSGLRDPEHAALGPMGGAIMETAVVSEVLRRLSHRGVEPQLYFWRTAAGNEVDLLVESGGSLIPLEVKLSATPRAAMAAGIRALRADLPHVPPGYVVHPGSVLLPLGSDATAIPFAEL